VISAEDAAMPRRFPRSSGLVAALAALVGFGLTGAHLGDAVVAADDGSRTAARALFARPSSVPHPAENRPNPDKLALGERLFHEPRLSAGGAIACATCHDNRLGFADGLALSTSGASGRQLRRHTPSLWDLAWAPRLFWDGRAGSLEEQALGPLTHPDEMAGSMAAAVRRLGEDASYVAAFARAFPQSPAIDEDRIVQALASWQRTLVSPPTAFDRWVAGDDKALGPEAVAGLALFMGKAGCVRCHVGFAFTDHAFHDIGLPGRDKGRGAVVGVGAVDHAFKTPGLREAAWSAPYMHDGSLATLEDVVRHYEGGGIMRPSRSPDMPAPFELSDDERARLIAFLDTLSSETPPRPSREAWVGRAAAPTRAVPVAAASVSQRGRQFTPSAVRVRAGETLTILNDDDRTHNVRIDDPHSPLNSGAQEPGEHVSLRLDRPGHIEAYCAIHPTMRLSIAVEPAGR
jgi:cytochrome c peroxidase